MTSMGRFARLCGLGLLMPLILLTVPVSGAEDASEPPPQNQGANDDAPPPVSADASATQPPPADASAPAGTAAGAEGGAKPPPEDRAPGVFIPSEEISEDFAVSFPVDI